MHRRHILQGLGALGASALAPPAFAQESVENFYRGRTIMMTVPTSPGGINDISGRLVGRHLGRFIPGHPTLVPENMPGAGSFKAANYLYAVAPKASSPPAKRVPSSPLRRFVCMMVVS